MKAITDAISKILKVIGATLFAALVLVVVWQVFARLVLHQPQAWTDEASRMVFVWVGLFAAALVFGERGHIAVDFVVSKLPLAGRKTVGVLIQVLIIFFAAALMVYGGIRASGGASNQRLSALQFLTLGQMYWVLPITGVLIIIYAIGHIVRILAGTEPPFPASEEEQLLEEMAAEGALPAPPEPGAPSDGSNAPRRSKDKEA